MDSVTDGNKKTFNLSYETRQEILLALETRIGCCEGWAQECTLLGNADFWQKQKALAVEALAEFRAAQ